MIPLPGGGDQVGHIRADSDLAGLQGLRKRRGNRLPGLLVDDAEEVGMGFAERIGLFAVEQSLGVRVEHRDNALGIRRDDAVADGAEREAESVGVFFRRTSRIDHFGNVGGRREQEPVSVGVQNDAHHGLDGADASVHDRKIFLEYFYFIHIHGQGKTVHAVREIQVRIIVEQLRIGLARDLARRTAENVRERVVAEQVAEAVVDILHRQHERHGVDGGVPQGLGVFQLHHAQREFGHVLHDAGNRGRPRITQVEFDLHAVVMDVVGRTDPERELHSLVRHVLFDQVFHVLLEDRKIFRMNPMFLEDRFPVFVYGPQFVDQIGSGALVRVDLIVERRQTGYFGRVFEVRQDSRFFPVGVLDRMQCVFELFPQFGLLLPLFFDGLGAFHQFPVDSHQFSVVEPNTDDCHDQCGQDRDGEDDQQDMFPEIIHQGKSVHLHQVGIRSLVDESGIEQRQSAVHQQHQANVFLRKCHVEDIIGLGLCLFERMVFARFQQRFGSESVQECSVRRPVQQAVETPWISS